MNIRPRCWLLASTALALVGFPAAAQQTGGLSDIVVTSQKRSENLQDVPIAVTALSSGELAGANIDGQLTLPKITPNLNFTVVASFASAYIRGVGTQFANPGLESSVPVYFDDTYVPRAAAGMFTFGDIERIEVLKGPQGTLYGRNATGGAIRLITRDPKQKFEAAASVTGGSDERMAIEGMVNIPLTEWAALRVSGRHDENGGFMKNISPNAGTNKYVPKDLEVRNEEIWTAKLLMTPTDKLTVKISGDYERKDGNEGHTFQNLFPSGPEQVGLAAGGLGNTKFYNAALDFNTYENVTSYGIAGRIDYDLGAATVSSMSAYRQNNEFNCADLDGTSANIQGSCGRPHTRQITQEFQIASPADQRFRYVAGLYYLYERSDYDFRVSGSAIDAGFGGLASAFGLNAPLVFANESEGVSTDSYAPYAQIDYDFTDQLTLTLGARYTHEKKVNQGNVGGIGEMTPNGFLRDGTFVGSPLFALGLSPTPFCVADGETLCEELKESLTSKKFTPKATISYKPNDDLMVYATASRGVKSGGFNLPAFGAVDAVQPETLDDFEVGWKYQAGAIRFNGAAFYYDYKDLQIQITDQTTGGTRVKNAAGAEVMGVEGDLTWVPNDAWEFGLGGGYLDTKYKNFIGDAYTPCADVPGLSADTPEEIAGKAAAIFACAPTAVNPTGTNGLGLALVGGRDLSGNKLVNAPKVSGYLRSTYTVQLADMGAGDSGRLQFSSILSYRAKAYFDPANNFEDKDRVLLSARAQWFSADDKLSLAVYGENLTGKKYFVSRPAQSTGGWQTPAAPTQVFVQLSAKF
ncbi:MAG: TonB-dependent receptor [Caulobacterales bacterium]